MILWFRHRTKKTKSHYKTLERYNCTEIYNLCDFVMKAWPNQERDFARAPLLYEVLYTYITDRAFCNTSLDCYTVIKVLKHHNINNQAILLEKILAATDKRFFWSIVIMSYNPEKKTVTFSNERSGILDVLSV